MSNQSANHSELVTHILLKCSNGSTRLFRNNVGVLQDKRGQYVRYGVCNPGGSDLIGWETVIVTPEMVGRKIAVFLGIEVKTGGGRQSEPQRNFQAAVTAAGGKAGVARSVDDAKGIIAVALEQKE